jgi:hypothetical protein
MKSRILARLAQVGLHGLAHTADAIDHRLKHAFEEPGLPAPERTRGQIFAATVRSYAARLDRQLPRGTRQ